MELKGGRVQLPLGGDRGVLDVQVVLRVGYDKELQVPLVVDDQVALLGGDGTQPLGNRRPGLVREELQHPVVGVDEDLDELLGALARPVCGGEQRRRWTQDLGGIWHCGRIRRIDDRRGDQGCSGGFRLVVPLVPNAFLTENFLTNMSILVQPDTKILIQDPCTWFTLTNLRDRLLQTGQRT